MRQGTPATGAMVFTVPRRAGLEWTTVSGVGFAGVFSHEETKKVGAGSQALIRWVTLRGYKHPEIDQAKIGEGLCPTEYRSNELADVHPLRDNTLPPPQLPRQCNPLLRGFVL